MKKNIYIIFTCLALTIAAGSTSCNNNGTVPHAVSDTTISASVLIDGDTSDADTTSVAEITEKYTNTSDGKMWYDERNINNAAKKMNTNRVNADSVLKQIRSCVLYGTADCPHHDECGNDYCTQPVCGESALCCHNLAPDVFDQITTNHQTDWVRFPIWKLKRLIRRSDCATQKFQADMVTNADGSRICHIKTVANNATTNADYTVFYSVLLIRAIVNTKPMHVYFYKGEVGDNNEKILPIKVKYTADDIRYYDVSNDIP